MKNKNKKSIFIFKLCVILPILFLAVFLFSLTCHADETLKITKIQFGGGAGKADEDFIEITNETDQEINLKGYRLVKRASSASSDTTIKSWTSDALIAPSDTHLWANSKNSFAETIGADTNTTQTISEGNGVALRLGKENEGIIIDSINWNNNEEDPEEEQAEPKNYSGIKINEINAETSDEEFVEIINNGEKNIDFSEWCIKDEIKYKKANWDCKKPSSVEKNDNFHILSGSFSLNNDAEGDTVYLYDEDKNFIDSVPYRKARAKYSYSFDGSSWRWTKQITRGAENAFDKLLSGKIKKDDKIYANTYANFEVSADKDAQKFTWDFGDNHKSYLKKTKHKYEKPGDYAGSLKITGDGEDAFYNFTVEVEKYSAPKIQIKSFSPNPKGNDAKNEFVILENKSKNKINLKGWSLATGTKNLVNHPIREDFVIKPGNTKKLTRKISAFTLGNQKTKIELRSPDGKTVQKIKYDRKKNKIQEDELYEKTDNGWTWIEAQTDTDLTPNNTDNTQATIDLAPTNTEIASGTPAEVMRSENITPPEPPQDNPGQILGAETVKPEENHSDALNSTEKRSWARRTLEKSFQKINLLLNKLLLNFS